MYKMGRTTLLCLLFLKFLNVDATFKASGLLSCPWTFLVFEGWLFSKLGVNVPEKKILYHSVIC